MKAEWEVINSTMWDSTRRMPVIGGWLVKHSESSETAGGYISTESMVFVSDPQHEWEVEPVLYQPETPEWVNEKPAVTSSEPVDDLPF